MSAFHERESRRNGVVRVLGRDRVLVGLVFLFGLALALPFAWNRPSWTPDGLFYMAQTLEVRGESQAKALHDAFTSAGATEAGLNLNTPAADNYQPAVDNPRWVAYSAPFYRRRWTVPILAAAVTPLFGTSSLQDVSLLGWAVLAPGLFLLMRRRFSAGASLTATALSMVLAPLIQWAPHPLSDSWGLTFLAATLLLVLLARDDLRWLPAWAALVLVGSFTRDVAIIIVVATGWLAIRERSRPMAVVTAIGILASLPAPLIFSTALRDELAYVFSGFQIPAHTGWGWIFARYPHALYFTLRQDLTYPLHVATPYNVLAFILCLPVLLGLIMLFRSGRDPFLTLMRGAAVGALLTIAILPNYTGLRLELIFIPSVATGLALLCEQVWPQVRQAQAGRRRIEAARSLP
jgi:hypothetical protein